MPSSIPSSGGDTTKKTPFTLASLGPPLPIELWLLILPHTLDQNQGIPLHTYTPTREKALRPYAHDQNLLHEAANLFDQINHATYDLPTTREAHREEAENERPYTLHAHPTTLILRIDLDADDFRTPFRDTWQRTTFLDLETVTFHFHSRQAQLRDLQEIEDPWATPRNCNLLHHVLQTVFHALSREFQRTRFVFSASEEDSQISRSVETVGPERAMGLSEAFDRWTDHFAWSMRLLWRMEGAETLPEVAEAWHVIHMAQAIAWKLAREKAGTVFEVGLDIVDVWEEVEEEGDCWEWGRD